MPEFRKVPVTVITGFLGAGKTSLIRNLIEKANGRRYALIINEFGDIGVDGDLLRGCGEESCKEEDIVELTNGCLCCTVADDFLPTLEFLLEREEAPDHIIIETSGLALPKPLIKAFQWPEVSSRATVDGVVTVVDGPAVLSGLFAEDPIAVNAQREADEALDHESPLEELFEEQLGSADLVLISKADLIAETDLPAVEAACRPHLRPSVQTITLTRGQVSSEILLGLEAAAEEDLESRHSHHDGLDGEHDHDDFETLVVRQDPFLDVGSALARAEDLLAIDGVLRVKGIVQVEGKAARLVLQGVGQRLDHYFDRPRDGEKANGHLVVIGLKGFDRTRIVALASSTST